MTARHDSYIATTRLPYMYQNEHSDNMSQIPMGTDVDLSRFPLFAKAKPMRIILEEG
jgi:hypothetical protein